MKKVIAILLVLTTVFAISGCAILSADKPFAVMKAKTSGEETPDDGETAAPGDFESGNPEGYYGSQTNTPAATIAWTVNNPYQIIFNKYNGFILPESSDRYLLTQDLQGLTVDELYIAANEIAARKGASFSDLYLQEYFIHQSWYTQSQTLFNPTEIEKANTDLIYAARDMAMQSSDRIYWGADKPGNNAGYPNNQYPGYQDPGYQYPGYQYPGYQYPGYQDPSGGNQSGNQTPSGGNQGGSQVTQDGYVIFIREGNSTYCYHIPQIQLPGVNTNALNQEMYDKFYPQVKEAMDVADQGYSLWFYGLHYTIGQKGDIVSILVQNTYDADCIGYTVYNLHASTGQRASEDEVYAAFGTSEAEYWEIMRSSLEKYAMKTLSLFEENAPDYVNQCLQETIDDANVNNCVPFVDENGNLRFTGSVNTFAGAGWYDYIFDDAGNGYRIYCAEH